MFQTPPLEGALPTVMSTFAVRRGGEGVSPNVGQGHGAFGIGQRKVGDGLPQTRQGVRHPRGEARSRLGALHQSGSRRPWRRPPEQGVVGHVDPLHKFSIDHGVRHRKDFRQLKVSRNRRSVGEPQRVPCGQGVLRMACHRLGKVQGHFLCSGQRKWKFPSRHALCVPMPTGPSSSNTVGGAPLHPRNVAGVQWRVGHELNHACWTPRQGELWGRRRRSAFKRRRLTW